MLCPVCNTEMRINRTHYQIEKQADGTQKLFIVQDLICRNKNCSKNNIVYEMKHEQETD